MSAGLTEQIERGMRHLLGVRGKSCSDVKARKHRTERRRAKQDPECLPCYRKYRGYEY